jgi:hypothetical protein
LQERLIRARWLNELPGVGWQYGVPINYARIYYETNHMEHQLTEPITTPIALAMFRDDGRTFRRPTDRAYKNIAQRTLL